MVRYALPSHICVDHFVFKKKKERCAVFISAGGINLFYLILYEIKKPMRAFHPVSLFEYHWMNETGEWAMRLLCVIISHFKHLSCWYYICIRLNQVVFINFVHIVRRAARCRCCCSFFTWYVRLSAVLNCAHSVELNFTLNGQSAFTPATFFRQKITFWIFVFFSPLL